MPTARESPPDTYAAGAPVVLTFAPLVRANFRAKYAALRSDCLAPLAPIPPGDPGSLDDRVQANSSGDRFLHSGRCAVSDTLTTGALDGTHSCTTVCFALSTHVNLTQSSTESLLHDEFSQVIRMADDGRSGRSRLDYILHTLARELSTMAPQDER